jgi:formate dehydrogenase major subunit
VTRYLIDNGFAKTRFLNRWVNGFDEYYKSLEPFTMEFAAKRCGLPLETLHQVAQMIADAEKKGSTTSVSRARCSSRSAS